MRDSTRLENVTNLAGTGRANPIANSVIDKTSSNAAISLLFAPGHRPEADDVARVMSLPAESTSFSISFRPSRDDGWLELLAMGLTYELSGLSPQGQAPTVLAEHLFGLERSIYSPRPEAVCIVPGPHIASAGGLLPVVRVLAGLGAELARLPGVRAVGWEPSRSWMAPAYFMSLIRAWLAGGAFPALGLTALNRTADGAMESQGLSLFTGFEVRIEPLAGESAQDTARLAARVIHVLVEGGVEAMQAMRDPGGRPLASEYSADRHQFKVWRAA